MPSSYSEIIKKSMWNIKIIVSQRKNFTYLSYGLDALLNIIQVNYM